MYHPIIQSDPRGQSSPASAGEWQHMTLVTPHPSTVTNDALLTNRESITTLSRPPFLFLSNNISFPSSALFKDAGASPSISKMPLCWQSHSGMPALVPGAHSNPGCCLDATGSPPHTRPFSSPARNTLTSGQRACVCMLSHCPYQR
jgi:hypothetical protein